MIATPNNDIACKGAYTGETGTVSTTTQVIAAGTSRIVPFLVAVEGSYPTSGSSTELTILASTTIGRFKVTNNGSAKITLDYVDFTDNGSHTSTHDLEVFKLYASDENSSNYTGTEIDSKIDNVQFGELTTDPTISGGAYRYLTVQVSTLASITSGDSFNLSAASIGDLQYKVAESDLGYDGNYSGTITGNIDDLYISGTPAVGTLTKK